MKALITGASSGIGRDMAISLSNRGYDLILVARDLSELKNTAKLCSTKVECCKLDLSIPENCIKLYNKYPNIDLLINDAGFGIVGNTINTSLDKELNMIDLNIKAVHILTKLYLKKMVEKDSGRILNVASSAAFLPGPLMNTYYSTKSYVYRFTLALYEELRRSKSNVHISVLCPGPVNTNFNNIANVEFSVKALDSKYVADYAINKMLKNKLVIIPGLTTKLSMVACKFLPTKFSMMIDYNIQKKKEK